MYIIDITRCQEEQPNDLLVGKNSMDAKRKIMSYLSNYVLANYNIELDEDILDQNLNIELFYLKDFLKNHYSILVDKDLIIQSTITNKENCLFVKMYNENRNSFPIIYNLGRDRMKDAKILMCYLINDELIIKNENNLEQYEKEKLIYSSLKENKFTLDNINCEIISLYQNGMFLDELLDSDYSLNQIKYNLDIKM